MQVNNLSKCCLKSFYADLVLCITFLCAFSYLNIAKASEQAKVLVKVAKIKQMEVSETVTSVGEYRSNLNKKYYAGGSGTVDFISLKQGSFVKEGEKIISIDEKVAVSSKTSAEAKLKVAERAYARNKALYDKGILSQDILEASGSELNAAKFNLENTMKQYNDAVITAPFDGYLGVAKPRLFQKVNAGDYLVEIFTSSNGGEIVVELPPRLLGKLDTSTETVVVLSDLGAKIKAKLSAASQYLSPNGTVVVRVSLDSTEAEKIPNGSYVKLELHLDKHFALAVPEQCVLRNNQGSFVYVVDQDKVVHQVYVKLGTRTNDNFVELISNEVHDGDDVILEGLNKVKDGLKVDLLTN